MFQIQNRYRDAFMLEGAFAREGYDWWWHSFTGRNVNTGEERTFFVEYYLCNPALGKKYPVLGQLPKNKQKGRKPSYLMVKAGWWGKEHCQLHRFYGWKEVSVRKGAPYAVRAEGCYASEHCLKGMVRVTREQVKNHPEWMCDAGSMEWNLSVDKQIAFHAGYGASWLLRKLKAFEMYWHAEGMKTTYSGTVICNGEAYKIVPEDSYGYADKNWGRGFTSPWIWLSSNDIVSKLSGKRLKNSVFDIGGGRPKVFGVAMERKLLGGFYYEGEEFEFNFSKFWMAPGTRFSCKETKDEVLWHIRQENKHAVMDVRARCKKTDMLLINYEEPDGRKRHKHLWNGGNGEAKILLFRKQKEGLVLVDEMLARHVGCEYGEI